MFKTVFLPYPGNNKSGFYNISLLFTFMLLFIFDIQLLFEGKPSRGMGNSVAIFEIHIIPGYCIGRSSA